jgi:hypothetical protein
LTSEAYKRTGEEISPITRSAFERLPDSSRRHWSSRYDQSPQNCGRSPLGPDRGWQHKACLYGDPSNLSVDALKTCQLVHRSVRQRIHPSSPAQGIRSNYVKHNPMKTSTTQVKRKIGRPSEIGADKFVGLRLPGGLVNRVGTWAKQSNVVSRSEAIRLLLEKGLEK